MSDAYLDPEPFRQWYQRQKEHYDAEEIARWLGVDSRTLRRWDEDDTRIRRGELEDALMRSHFSMWDIYPGLDTDIPSGQTHGWCRNCTDEVPIDADRNCLWCGARAWKGKPGQPKGRGAKLTDAQVRDLYVLHLRGVPVVELARRIWKSAGYKTPAAAEKGIRNGFIRLNLQTVRPPFTASRRCKGTKQGYPRKGTRCTRPAMFDSEFCREHDPSRRDEVMANIIRATEVLEAAA